MATFIALIDYTEQGVRSIQESPQRTTIFAEQAKQMGVTVKDLYWTYGGHDGVLILEAPDEQAASALLLSLVRAGNVKTQTLRAYDRAEMEEILART
jgi:uncharacterized protein with GYD domain